MVRVVPGAPAEGLKEIAATLISVTKNCECELCKKGEAKIKRKRADRPRFHLVLKPEREDYNLFHVFLTADKRYVESNGEAVGEGTQIADFTKALLNSGLKSNAKTLDELLKEALGHKFLWQKAKAGRATRETWLPVKLLETPTEPTKQRKITLELTPEEAEKIKQLLKQP